MTPARWAARRRPWKLEIRNWKLDTALSFKFQVSLFPNPNAKVRRWAEEKKFTSKATKLLKTKDRRTN
jgi:hypothetical protein